MRNPLRTLRGRLLLPILAAGILAVAGTAVAAFTLSQRTLRDRLLDRLEVTAAVKAGEVDRWVEDASENFFTIASLPAAREKAPAFLRGGPGTGRGDAAAAALRAGFRSVVERGTFRIPTPISFREIFLLEPSRGRVVLSTDPSREGESQGDSPYFLRGREGEFTSPLHDEAGSPTFTFSLPVRDPAGGLLGVLGAHLNPDRLDEISREGLPVGLAARISLVDEHGHLVATSPGLTSIEPLPLRSFAVGEALAGRAGRGLYTDHQGVPVVGAFRWLPRRGVAVLAEIPQRAAFAPARSLAWSIFFLGTGMMALLAATLVVAAGRVTRPVLEVAAAAGRMEKGDFSARARVLASDETGELAESFNRMAGRLEELYRDMEEMVRLRTTELEEAHALLVRKEHMAALGELTAVVSHEIRNPLGTVRNSIFSLRDAIDRREGERVDRALLLAERNIVRCDRIIRELLDFTRKGEVVLRDVPLDPLVREVLEEAAPPPWVTLDLRLESEAVLAVDPELLRRALVNLVTNAVQSMEEDSGPEKRLIIATCRQGGRAEVTVEDSGPGVADEARGRIFEPLFSTRGFGVGLGLPIVKGIMERMGGGVELKEKGGRGACFLLWLPLERWTTSPQAR